MLNHWEKNSSLCWIKGQILQVQCSLSTSESLYSLLIISEIRGGKDQGGAGLVLSVCHKYSKNSALLLGGSRVAQGSPRAAARSAPACSGAAGGHRVTEPGVCS